MRSNFGLTSLRERDFIENALDSQAILQDRRMLQVIMDVRLGGIPRVAALAEDLPALHFIAGLHLDTPLLEMGQNRNLIFPVLDDHAVAYGRIGIHRTGRIVANSFN